MDRTHENDKTIALAQAHGFHVVVTPKKNRKSHWLYDKQFYKQRNIVKRYFLHLKCFRKVLTFYDKFDSIFLSTVSLAFIFDLLFYVNTT